TDWQLGAPVANPFRPEQQLYPLTAGDLAVDCVCSTGPDGVALAKRLVGFTGAKATRPPLYGLLHVEMGRLVLQPLTAFSDDGPLHLMIEDGNIDLAQLMKTMDFRS
ncbi:MAG TPA: hypothetical protein VLT45_02595, partial [Kofleriaceae bacterium]|nr:hypothetical protein [Kofleriaceae bacterium]